MKNLYYKLYKLKNGINLCLELTWRCNFNCAYCPDQSHKKWVNKYEKNMHWWIKYIETFPIKIKQISLCGGEPTLISWVPDFVNYLIDKGFFVTLYTNLSNMDALMKINKSLKFIIITNYHSEYLDGNMFLERLNLLKHQYQAGEFKELSNISDKLRSIKLIKNLNELKQTFNNSLRVSPEGRLAINCYDAAIGNYKFDNILNKD